MSPVHYLNHVLAVADPRGRCNRTALLSVALTLLALQATCYLVHQVTTSAAVHMAATLVEILCLWVATSAAIKRLHDLSLSGWWIPISVGALFVWTMCVAFACYVMFGDSVAEPGTPGFLAYIAIVMFWPLVATVWLHFARGEAGPNRYGPEPDESGLSFPEPDAAGATAEQAA